MFLIESEILCNSKISDEEDIRADSDFTQFPIDRERIRIKMMYDTHFNTHTVKCYDDYAVFFFNGIDGEMISYEMYEEEPETKKITSDELYKYYE